MPNAEEGSWNPESLRGWLEGRGARGVTVEAMAGGASLRRYWRARGGELPGGGETVVLMTLPQDGPASEELGGPGASAEADFIAVGRWFAGLGLPVPRLHAVASEDGILVLEDLGDRRLYDEVMADRSRLLPRYEEALDLLVDLQAKSAAAPEDSPGHAKRCDEPTLAAELEHFLEYGVEARQGRPLEPGSRDTLEAIFDDVCSRLSATPYALAHRDFQSQNLMVTGRGLVMIDFQDAFVAPPAYDLVALLRDSYVVLSAEELETLLERYHARRMAAGIPEDPLVDRADLEELFHLQTIQRKLKDAGRFEYIDKVKGNPGFLRFFADSVTYAVEALERFPEYAEALEVLARIVPEAAEARRRVHG